MKTNLNLLAAGIFLTALGTGFGQSTLQFSTNLYYVAENAGSVILTVQRTGDTNGAVSVDYASANGTAIAGSDYTATNGTLTFAAGETNQTLAVPILNDGIVEPAVYETFTVTLSNPTNAVLGTRTVATGRITDNDKALQFEFGSATFGSYRVGEAEGFILLGVTRDDDGNFPVSVDFATSNWNATNGLDYTATNGTLTFAAGEKVQTFAVPILNDGLREGNESFRVTLSNPTNQVLGSQNLATVTIMDNDAGVQFVPFNLYRVAENEGARTLTVVRGNDGNLGPITVDYATSDLTATNGLDYVATNGTLSFAQGEMVKTITLPILYDEVPEADEQFKVTLSNPTGGAVLGPSTATIVILDITNTPPHRFDGIAVQPDRSVQLTLGGSVDGHFRDYFDLYPIEVSTNLVNWAPLVTLLRTNAATNVLTYTDSTAANFSQRFYRTASNHLITPWVKPTGPFTPGVVSRLLTDPTRRNRYWLSTKCSFMVSVWYPAVAQAGQLPGRFIDLQIAQDPTWMANVGAADFTARMPYLKSHALPDAPCATSQAPYPVVLNSPGWGGMHGVAAGMGENLASHGYVVVSMDHHDANRVVFPDGTYLQGDTSSGNAATGANRVKDLLFIMEELARWNTNDPVFAGRLDLAKVASLGGSAGGDTTADFAAIEPHCKALIALDGGAGATALPLQQPVLQINNSGAFGTGSYDKTINHAIWFQVSNTDHLMIAGVDWYWAWHPENVAGGREVARTINAYSLWFLNKYLKGSSDPMPELADYPRVIGFKQK